MKHISILSIALLATALMGCDEIEKSNSTPITNPQLPLVQVNNIVVTAGEAINGTSALDLQKLSDAGTEKVLVYTVNNSSAELPEGSTVWGNFEMSATEDFADPVIFDNVTDAEGNGYLTLGQLTEARVSMFGKSPNMRTIYYRVSLFAEYDGAQYQLIDGTTTFLEGSFDEYGLDLGFVIEDKYYLIGPDGWDPAKDLIEFEHSSASVYDDPVFTLTFNVTSPDAYWKIVPESVAQGAEFNWDGLLGTATDGDTALEGKLVEENAQSGKIEQIGKYKMTINLEEMTYSLVLQTTPDWMGTPNTSQDWDLSSSQHLYLHDNTFSGFAYFGGEWGGKFGYVKADGSEVWIGMEGEPTYVENNGDPYYEITVVIGEGGNIFEGGEAKLYWIDFDWNNLKVYMREVKTAGMVGEFNGWDAGGSTGLAPENGSKDLVWSGNVTFADASQWKFCFNGGWTVNLGAPGDSEPVALNAGDTLSGLVGNGKNFSTPAGSYKVTLDLTSLPYTVKLVAN